MDKKQLTHTVSRHLILRIVIRSIFSFEKTTSSKDKLLTSVCSIFSDNSRNSLSRGWMRASNQLLRLGTNSLLLEDSRKTYILQICVQFEISHERLKTKSFPPLIPVSVEKQIDSLKKESPGRCYRQYNHMTAINLVKKLIFQFYFIFYKFWCLIW